MLIITPNNIVDVKLIGAWYDHAKPQDGLYKFNGFAIDVYTDANNIIINVKKT